MISRRQLIYHAALNAALFALIVALTVVICHVVGGAS